MTELPPISQVLELDASVYLEQLDRMTRAAERLSAACSTALDRLADLTRASRSAGALGELLCPQPSETGPDAGGAPGA